MTPQDYAAKVVYEGTALSTSVVSPVTLSLLYQAVADAIRAYGDERAAEEREACAKLVEHVSHYRPDPGVADVSIRAGERLAASIRARGKDSQHGTTT